MAISENFATNDKSRVPIKEGTESLPVICYEDNLEQIEIPWHWQNAFEIGIVMSGEAIIGVEAERFPLSKGHGYFINAGTLNTCIHHPDHTGECSIRSIVFSPTLVGDPNDGLFYDNYAAPIITNNALKGFALNKDEAWQKETLRLAEQCWRSCLECDEAIESGVRDIVSQMIFLLSSHCDSETRAVSPKDIRDSDRIRMMLDYIDHHYKEDINISVLSENAEISESETMRCFHNMLGTTPIQYLKNYRIRKAAELLRISEEKIVDIAIDCGFQDMSYFAKTFREAKGITPTDFREKYKTKA